MAKKKMTPNVPLPSVASPDGKPVIAFETPARFDLWLATHHAEHNGVWIRFFKVASGHKSITYAEALDVALCYGWIDGPLRKGDEVSWIHKFTPRGKRSVWSQVNKAHIERLTREGLMKPAGNMASQFYATLSKANRYAFYYRLHNAKKPETKARKIMEFIAMLERGETFH
jgi:uncharacterized protein YdeI (YjbR/CyaY-like superfamily)